MQRTRVLHQQRNRSRPCDYSAYLVILLASLFKLFAHALGVDGLYDQNHSDPHIECSIHLLFAYVRGIAKNLKNRQHRPRPQFYLDRGSLGQDTRNVLKQAAAGDVRESLYRAGSKQRPERAQIAAVRLQELFANRASKLIDVDLDRMSGSFQQELSGQTETVGMEADRRQTDQEISFLDSRAVDYFALINHANDETGYIVFAFSVEAGHLGGFSANERTAVFFAASSQPFDHLRDGLRIELRRGDI